jgi:ribosomal protein L37AE/L43A
MKTKKKKTATKSQMKCSKCGFKKDLGKGAKMLWSCPKCGAEAGAGFDVYEVPVEEKDSSGRN